MLSPWLAGTIAKSATLRRGLMIPVVNAAMIVILQIILSRIPDSQTTAPAASEPLQKTE
jgi:hypothetical protein